MREDDPLAGRRAAMLALLGRRGVRDARVIAAMRDVPREAFVPRNLREYAYDDGPLPIAQGQTISQPFIVALMAEAAAVTAEDRVLEVGAGSGYAAALLARLSREVFGVERHAGLAQEAAARLRDLGVPNARIRHGDGTLGWPEEAPFDAIIVSAAGPAVPATLRAQLAPGGRLVIPVGRSRSEQRLLRLTRHGEDFEEADLGPVAFVPLIGAEAWTGEDAVGPG